MSDRLELASIRYMAATSDTVVEEQPASRLRALRRLLSGVSYPIGMTFVLMTGWGVETFIGKLPTPDVMRALGESLFFFGTMMVHQLPTALLLTISLNLAPRAGYARIAWLAGTVIAMWAYCTAFFYWMHELDDYNLLYACMLVMIVAGCSFRSAARTATSTLTRYESEAVARDADIKRARLQLLRAQIEPHFLFNTLATIRTLARVDAAAAAEMIDNLMRYLSEALPKMRHDESSLAEELTLIDAYLRMHQVRMGSRLSYELLMPEALAAVRVPTMVLLTLVENAVKHGVGPALDGGSIRVSAERERETLVLRVTDSGKGLSITEGHGTGLANIRRRLAALYGERAVLSLTRLVPHGMTATVLIPQRSA
jgi:two-component sensor histidine kinase